MTVLELDVTSGKSVREAVRDVERHPLVVEKRRRRMMMLCGKEREESDGDKEEEKHKTTKGAEGRGLALGGLDILINNAGMLSFMPLLDINFGDNEHGSCSDGGEERIARKVFEVNFWGALRVIRGFRGLLVKDFPPAGGGKGKDGDGEDNDERKVMVVNVSSMAGEVGVPWMGELDLVSFYRILGLKGVEGGRRKFYRYHQKEKSLPSKSSKSHQLKSLTSPSPRNLLRLQSRAYAPLIHPRP